MAAGFKVIDEAADDRMAGARSVAAYAPRILVYPLRGYCLPVLLLGTLLVWILVQTLQAFVSGEPYGIVAALLRIVVVVTGCSWLLTYILRVIEFTASGHATPPPMTADTLQNAALWLMRALPYPAAVLSLVFAVFEPLPQLAWAFAGLGVLLWPAHALSLATQGSAWAAVNPLRLLQIVLLTSGIAYGGLPAISEERNADVGFAITVDLLTGSLAGNCQTLGGVFVESSEKARAGWKESP